MGLKRAVKPVTWFKPHHQNPRSHPPGQLEHLRSSLEDLGVYRNVVARPDGTLLAGHGVVEAAQAEGIKKLPVAIFTGTELEERRLLLGDNALAEMAQDNLSQVLALAEEQEGNLVGTGIDQGYLETLRAVAASDALIEGEGVEPPDMPGWEEPATALSVTIRCATEEEQEKAADALGLELSAKRVRYHFSELGLET